MITCKDKQFKVFLRNETIQARLQELALAINERYAGKEPVFLSVLNGVFRVVGDLFRYVEVDCAVSFVKLKSYEGTSSTGEVSTLLGLDMDLTDRHVLLVEDIVDTGKTLHEFLPQLEALNPASIAIFTLLTKPEAIQYDIPLDYIGFEVPNHFLVGYGLDYDGLGRQYNDIYQLAE
ncbi:MAG: hypoxanthine phosphoribosyltransferase [Aureispira sp.]